MKMREIFQAGGGGSGGLALGPAPGLPSLPRTLTSLETPGSCMVTPVEHAAHFHGLDGCA